MALHPRYRIVVHNSEGRISDNLLDTRAFARDGEAARPQVSVILSGSALVRQAGANVWLGPGDVLVASRRDGLLSRNDGIGEAFRCIDLEPDAELLALRSEAIVSTRVDATTRRRIEDCASNIERGDLAAARQSVATLAALLRALGLPLELDACLDDSEEQASPWAVRVAQALDAVLSAPEQSPSLDDVGARLGVSTRQANRLVAAFNKRYAFAATGWRETRTRARLLGAMYAMTNPSATTDSVAHRFGFRSPSAFCEAMQSLGLPSPGRVAAVVRDLV